MVRLADPRLPDKAKAAVPASPPSSKKWRAMKSELISVGLTCMRIQERHRQRQDLQSAEVRLTLQLKAICRRFVCGDKGEARRLFAAATGNTEHPFCHKVRASSAPLLLARESIRAARRDVERDLERDVQALPIWPRVAATRGLGALGLASIIGETGDLNNYSSHSKLWKRLGLAVIDGERQRRVRGAAAIKHGYSASRRSVVWQVGSAMLRAQSGLTDPATGKVLRAHGSYRLGYDTRKAKELLRVGSAAHAHNRAARYMEKRLIRNIWRAWNQASSSLE